MSSAVFFHNFNQIDLKLWTVACLATASIAGLTVMANQPNSIKMMTGLYADGRLAEESGKYKQARQDFDLALLQARARGDEKLLITALLNSARIDNEFEEDELAVSLAREAVSRSVKLYGINSKQYAEAVAALADVLVDNDESISLYKKALTIYKKQNDDIGLTVARILTELSVCYESKGKSAEAISAVKAALRAYDNAETNNSADYAKALIQYTNVVDIEEKGKNKLLQTALHTQEIALGKMHPALSSTLSLMAANQVDLAQKNALLARAEQIDADAFGANSAQVARDLLSQADGWQTAGKKKEALALRLHAASICRGNNGLAALSVDFLESYSKLLHELKFESDASRIDKIVSQKRAAHPQRNAVLQPANVSKTLTVSEEAEIENDPEYWQRTEMIPIDGVQKFQTENFDHLQLWYVKGALKLQAFNSGELILEKQFDDCPSGIVNASADRNSLTVSWRDGDGPVWHNDIYKIEPTQIKLVSSSTSDAYAQQIEQQLNDVINGETDAVNDGAVESVPDTYLNDNFMADAIRRGEHKALQLYGEGDACAAAERLAAVFDLTSIAINTRRDSVKSGLSKYEAWVDAWHFQQLPLADYITAFNDYGFFLQQNGCLEESAAVLALATRLAPHRALAYLNLADSEWKLGQKTKAKNSYLNYLRLQREQAGQAAIPPRVLQRITSAKINQAIPKTPAFKSTALGV